MDGEMNGEMDGEMRSVRLWYMFYGRPYSCVYVNEAAAAVGAWEGEMDGAFSTSGIEFADGRFLLAEDWEPFQEVMKDVPANELEMWRERPRPEGASW